MRFTRHHRRAWFQDDDGTFYRNCSLIMEERKRVIGRPRLTRELVAEWYEVWAEGVARKPELGKYDYVVQPARFRDAFPDKPGLWVLDEPDMGARRVRP